MGVSPQPRKLTPVAARRLVIVMLVLLGVSTLAAALVPVDPGSDNDQRTTAIEPAPRPEPQGEAVSRRISAQATRRARIRMRTGDQLELTVASRRADQVEIASLGELRDVDRDLPARFDLLPAEPGSYPIRLVEARRTIGRIEVKRRRAPRGSGLELKARKRD
jgi:hypothetical protein